MKFRLCLGALFCALAGLAVAQDVMKVAADHYKVLVDNAQVRVVENTLKPAEKDGLHTHPAGWYYVAAPGSMKVTSATGKVALGEPKAGKSGWMEAESPPVPRTSATPR